jgi:hypothetical protein
MEAGSAPANPVTALAFIAPPRGGVRPKTQVLIRATRTVFDDDPQPEPPACFCDPEHVAKIAETEAPAIASSSAATAPQAEAEEPSELAEPGKASDWRPKRLVRTVLASIADSKDFGKQMEREAKRRRFSEAKAKAFLGDGLPWNWSIWKQHFADFTPILDFVHVLSYLFLAAKAVHNSARDAWSQYLVWMRGAWQGDVVQVLEELRAWQAKLGAPDEEAADCDQRRVLVTTVNYLERNRDRMKYPGYRQAGLPVTTAWMESLVKEMNYRVKGTEMFWNDPDGAEAILQVRAASLCDDDRLVKHLRSRPGCPIRSRVILDRANSGIVPCTRGAPGRLRHVSDVGPRRDAGIEGLEQPRLLSEPQV